MECPLCASKCHIEIDTHADGFAENLQECGDCGALWTRKGEQAIIINPSRRQASNS